MSLIERKNNEVMRRRPQTVSPKSPVSAHSIRPSGVEVTPDGGWGRRGGSWIIVATRTRTTRGTWVSSFSYRSLTVASRSLRPGLSRFSTSSTQVQSGTSPTHSGTTLSVQIPCRPGTPSVPTRHSQKCRDPQSVGSPLLTTLSLQSDTNRKRSLLTVPCQVVQVKSEV